MFWHYYSAVIKYKWIRDITRVTDRVVYYYHILKHDPKVFKSWHLDLVSDNIYLGRQCIHKEIFDLE